MERQLNEKLQSLLSYQLAFSAFFLFNNSKQCLDKSATSRSIVVALDLLLLSLID